MTLSGDDGSLTLMAVPDDEVLVGTMIRNICYSNASQYLALPEG